MPNFATSPTTPMSPATTESSEHCPSEKSATESAERFSLWMALWVFSCVCVAAVATSNNDIDTAGEHWILVVCSLSLLVSFGAVLSYLCCRHLVVSQVPETAMTSVVLGLWAAGLPTIMNPGNAIAVMEEEPSSGTTTTTSHVFAPTVLNANLYFFAWLSFAACVGLSSSLYQEYIRYNPIYSAKIGRWYGLSAASLVVMGSAVRILQNTECDSDSSTTLTAAPHDFCRRTKFTVSVGVLGFALGIAMVYLTQKSLTIWAETTITSLNLVLFCFGVGYTTFGDGPGATIGNLYFSIWISFILSVLNFATCFRAYVSHRMEPPLPTQEAHPSSRYDDSI